jgi:hypothetical protein
MRWVSTSFASAALASAALVLTGCAAHKKDPLASLEHKQRCLFAAEDGAETDVVRTLLAKGTIPRSELARSFPTSIPKRDYLDANGNLLPLARMKGMAVAFYDDWMHELETKPGIGPRLLKAQRDARDAAADRCAELS